MKPYTTPLLVMSCIINFSALIAQAPSTITTSSSTVCIKLGAKYISIPTQLCHFSDFLKPLLSNSYILKELTEHGQPCIILDNYIPGQYGNYLDIFASWLNLLSCKKTLPLPKPKKTHTKLWDADSIIPLLSLSDYFMVAALQEKFTRKAAYFLNSGGLSFDAIPSTFKSDIASAYFLIFNKPHPNTKEYIRTTIRELAGSNRITKKATSTRKLTHLFLRQAKHLTDYVHIKTLTTLIMDHNHLRTLPNEFKQLHNLQKLDVSFNEIAEFPEQLPVHIKILNLSHNELDYINHQQLLVFKQLQNLSLAYNKFTQLCILAPTTLQTVSTQGNPLQQLPLVMYPKSRLDSSHRELAS